MAANAQALVAQLQRQFPLYLSKTSENVSRLNRLLSSTRNVDTTLLTVSYTVHLVHALLARLTEARLSLAARALAEKLYASAPGTLLPGESIVATITSSPDSRLVRAQRSSKALASLIDDHRMFMRLWGLPAIWSWGADTWRNPPEDGVLKAIQWTQVLGNATFQYLENGAYLASKGVFQFGEEKINRWFVWSARFWALHVLMEFARLARTRVLRRRMGLASGGEEKEDKLEKVKAEAKWWQDVYVNAAWMPLTLHWSTNGLVNEEVIALLSLFAGSFSLRQAWKATA